MTQSAIDYAKTVFDPDNPELGKIEELLKDNPEFFEMLCDPDVDTEDKHKAIDKVFQDSVRDFLKLFVAETEKVLQAELVYSYKPSEQQVEAIKQRLMKMYDKPEIDLKLTEDKSLVSGFLLRVGGKELDYSVRSRLEGLSQKLCQR